MQLQKLKLGQKNNDEGSINLAGANKKATLTCKKIIIKTLAKLYESVYCHSTFKNYDYLSIYLLILPHALADILGRCAVEQEKTEN